MAANPLPCPLHRRLKRRQAIHTHRLGFHRRKPQQKAKNVKGKGLGVGFKGAALRPVSLGNPRRQAEGHLSTPRSAAERVPARTRGSLDNSKYLATTFQDWLQHPETKWDSYRQKCRFQRDLLKSMQSITDQLEARKEKIEQILFNPAAEQFFIRHHRLDGRLQNALAQTREKLIRRRKEWVRLHNCQTEWLHFAASCCGTHLAVPIGCNHRLCFLCNGYRAEKFRERIRTMFDRLDHPIFLTLTIPNVPSLNKRRYSSFRVAWNKLRKMHPWIQGGMLAIETTYNNQAESKSFQTWHLHAHVLIGAAAALPVCQCHGGQNGDPGRKRFHRSGCAFIRFKRRIEFDWFLLTGGRKTGWSNGDFDYWFRQTERRDRSSARDQFNAQNRRVVDVRRVTNREKAAFEVLKYVTKASVFAHIPRAIDEFITATRGCRMVQTFGSWYGFKFEDDVNDWSHLECDCGAVQRKENKFVRMPGFLYREAVFMDEAGRWHPRPAVYERGTGPP